MSSPPRLLRLRAHASAALAAAAPVHADTSAAEMQAVAIAATLIGAVCFQMGLFCLVNHPDEDMRRYTYETISQTIAIFSAVLIFQTFNRIIEQLFLQGASDALEVTVNMVHMLCWFALMQAALAVISGAVGSWKTRCRRKHATREEVKVDLKCYAVVLAHITGFASINAWGSIQQLGPFAANPWLSLGTVFVAFLGQLLLQRVTDLLRATVTFMDEVEDEFEVMWNEETADAENDVMSLTLSFLACQSLRFWISDALPDSEGEEPWGVRESHTGAQCLQLLGWAVVFVVGLVIFFGQVSGLAEHVNNTSHDERGKLHSEKVVGQFAATVVDSLFLRSKVLQRTVGVVVTGCSMSFAWCAFFGSRWYISSLPVFIYEKDEMLSEVVLTLLLSLAAISVIYLLDKLADAEWTGARTDASIREVINGIGILVGFSWEQSFDEAMKSLSSVTPYPSVMRSLFAAFGLLVVMPAWRWWILPMVHQDGWFFGFIFPKKHQWSRVLAHDKFAEALTSLKNQQKKRPRREGSTTADGEGCATEDSTPVGESTLSATFFQRQTDWSRIPRLPTVKLDAVLNLAQAAAGRLVRTVSDSLSSGTGSPDRRGRQVQATIGESYDGLSPFPGDSPGHFGLFSPKRHSSGRAHLGHQVCDGYAPLPSGPSGRARSSWDTVGDLSPCRDSAMRPTEAAGADGATLAAVAEEHVKPSEAVGELRTLRAENLRLQEALITAQAAQGRSERRCSELHQSFQDHSFAMLSSFGRMESSLPPAPGAPPPAPHRAPPG